MMLRRVSSALASALTVVALTFVSPTSWSPAAADPTAADPSAAEDYDGIVALDNCSGSLVRWDDSAGSDAAMMLTNGHCYEGGFLDPGEVLTDEPSDRAVTLLASDASDAGTVHAEKLLYATMTDTDVALYQLDASYDEIESSYGATPRTMAEKGPADDTAITVLSGYWKKAYHCSVDAHIYRLKEGDWTWRDSLRYSQPGCETIHGTSGSPVLDDASGEVVGINNTGNDDGERCTVNNPCEVAEDGTVTYEKGRSYAQQTSWFYTCLAADGTLDLGREGCELPS